MRKICIGLAAPALQPAFVNRQQRLTVVAHDGESLAPFRWRRGVQPQLMAPALVAQHQIDSLQLQRRRLAHLIDPLQLALVNGDFGLRKNPVTVRAPGLAVRNSNARDKNLPVGGAANGQIGAVYINLLDSQRQQRMGRDSHHHLGQAQGLTLAGGVFEHHIAQLESGDQTRAISRQFANGNRYTQAA